MVQTVILNKLADAMPTAVDRDSSLRRLQRFFAQYVLDLDIIARMIFSLLPVKTGLELSLDRTNWNFGEFIGKEWTGWLNTRRIRYYIRIRQNFWIVKPSSGERIRAWWLFNDLRVGQDFTISLSSIRESMSILQTAG